MKRTPLKRKRATPRRRSETVPCSWPNYRCRKRAYVKVSETERYCKGHATDMADNLVGTFVKMRDNWTCQIAGINDEPCYGLPAVFWCHLIPKGRYGSIRWEPDNAVTGCAGHHRYMDGSEIERVDFAIRRLGIERWEELRLLARTQEKPKTADVILEFRDKVAA